MENKETRKENGDSPEKKNKERTPLTEAQRLKRQKMIVLPAMVLVFIGAMWLIFAPLFRQGGTAGCDGLQHGDTGCGQGQQEDYR